MGSASDAADSGRHAGQSINDAVSDGTSTVTRKAKGSPIAAGLIAFGAGLLVSSMLPASRTEQRAAESVKDTAQPVLDELTDAAKQAADHLKEPAQHAAEEVKATATDAVDTVKGDATDAADAVKSQAVQSKDAVQQAAHYMQRRTSPAPGCDRAAGPACLQHRWCAPSHCAISLNKGVGTCQIKITAPARTPIGRNQRLRMPGPSRIPRLRASRRPRSS